MGEGDDSVRRLGLAAMLVLAAAARGGAASPPG